MNWSIYNQSPVTRGEILLGFDVRDNWDTKIKEMNQGKIGEQPFHYHSIFILLLGYAKLYSHLPYRQTKEGIAQGRSKGKLPYIADFTTICKRE